MALAEEELICGWIKINHLVESKQNRWFIKNNYHTKFGLPDRYKDNNMDIDR